MRISSSTIGGGGSRRWRCWRTAPTGISANRNWARRISSSGAAEHEPRESREAGRHPLGLRRDHVAARPASRLAEIVAI
jgi:hypothetical protein